MFTRLLSKIFRNRKFIKRDFFNLARHYKKNYKKVLIFVFYALVAFFFALFFVGTKIFYPFHSLIALAFFIVSLVFLRDGILTYKKKLYSTNLLYTFYEQYGRYVFVFTIILTLFSIWFVVRPPLVDPFNGLSKEAARELVNNDLRTALMLMDRVETSGYSLIMYPALYKEDFSSDERDYIKSTWDEFTLALAESERLTEIHRYFSRLPFGIFADESVDSFMIGYSLYVKKHELFHRLMGVVGINDTARKILNEHIDSINEDDNYNKITRYYFQPKTIIKLNLGRLFLGVMNLFSKNDLRSEAFIILSNKAKASYFYMVKNSDLTLLHAFRVGKEKIENDMFNTWFPIQKTTANIMGEFYFSNRQDKFITLEQIKTMKPYLRTGDIMVQRRNWYMSNIGIPGFWPHSALYLGPIDEAAQYFSDIYPYEQYESFIDQIRTEYPDVFKEYNGHDENAYPYAVIEGKAEGIILESLEESAQADYLGVMRPRLDKYDILKAVLRSFSNFSKPYDYDFDFNTRDELVCSELIYDSYLTINGKKGINIELTQTAGRKMVSPTDYVKKFSDERGQVSRQLDFVYFLDGNETLNAAFVKSENDFAWSWQRPKYDWFQD